MRRFVLALALVLVAAPFMGCQVPPATQHVVNLTWTAPSPNITWTGCTTSAPCVYAVYRCSASASTCASTTNPAWAEITTSTTRVSGTAYTDSGANGLTAFYVVKTFQGSASSDPSNMAGPLVVPAVPIAPAINGTVASNDLKPLIAVPTATQELAMVSSVRLTARLR